MVEGEKLVLECTVIGKPTPVVTWKVGKFINVIAIENKMYILYIIYIVNNELANLNFKFVI